MSQRGGVGIDINRLDPSLRQLILQYQRIMDKINHLQQSIGYLNDEMVGLAVTIQNVIQDYEQQKKLKEGVKANKEEVKDGGKK